MDATSWPDMNWLGLVLALVANMVLGFLWYAKWSPTGKVWMRNMGMDPETMPAPPAAKMVVSMLLMVVGAFLMMFVFAHNFAVYEDAYRNVGTGGEAGYDLTLMDGIMGGFFTWLGFIVPIQLNGVAFENRKWSFFAVNAGYYLVSLFVAGILLVTVGA